MTLRRYEYLSVALLVAVNLCACSDAGNSKIAAQDRTSPAESSGGGEAYRSTLSSGGQGPEMVIVPAGQFRMGGPSYEVGREAVEDPVHKVSIRRFAMGKYPVTRGEFAAFVAATGYQTDAEKNTGVLGMTLSEGCYVDKDETSVGWKFGASWRDPGFPQDDDHPVVCVSWNDAHAYVEWLADQTGKRYRLPTEAETEYATRAGTTSPYPWGSDVDQACRYGNVSDASLKRQVPSATVVNCNDGYVFTSPVGHFQPNAFGLYDTIGNVWKWTEDCFVESYNGAPTDGSAQISKGCDLRAFRGAGWERQRLLRSAQRAAGQPAARTNYIGFRVAQDL